LEAIQSFMPEAAIDEVVPLRDEVVNGATGGHSAEENAGVAERDAAIHAARALLAELGFVQMQVKLVPVANAFEGWPVERQFAQIFYESSGLAHLRSG
jgi:hypothetical protein